MKVKASYLCWGTNTHLLIIRFRTNGSLLMWLESGAVSFSCALYAFRSLLFFDSLPWHSTAIFDGQKRGRQKKREDKKFRYEKQLQTRPSSENGHFLLG